MPFTAPSTTSRSKPIEILETPPDRPAAPLTTPSTMWASIQPATAELHRPADDDAVVELIDVILAGRRAGEAAGTAPRSAPPGAPAFLT